ncbi:MAG: DUF5668 domain-containing protein [Bacillota bacterium]
MRQWRVGSFSMGLVLVLMGVGLLLDRFSGITSSLEIIINWWPAVLILLGLEVLAAGFLFRSEQVRLKYDFFSMFLVALFFIFSLIGYALTYSGLIPAIREGLVSYEHTVSIPAAEIPLEGIEKVVLSYTDGDLALHSAAGDSVQIFGQALVYAPTAEKSAQLADTGAIETYRSGNTLYISIKQLPARAGLFNSGVSRVSRTVLIPANVSLDLQGSGSLCQQDLQVKINQLAAPWSINSFSRVKLLLSSKLDLTLHGKTTLHQGFLGNAGWQITEQEDETDWSRYSAYGTFALGEGTWPVYINTQSEITADILP